MRPLQAGALFVAVLWYHIDTMSRPTVRRFFSKYFLGWAYLSLVFQWFWMLTIILPPLVRSGTFDSFLTKPVLNGPGTTSQPITEASPLALIFVAVVTVVILVLTVVIAIRTPRIVIENSERVVNKAARAVVPIVTHHHAIPEKKRRVISRRVALGLRLIATVIPLIVCLSLPSFDQLTKQIIVTIAVWLAGFSIVNFVSAWLLEPPVKPISRIRSPASRG